MGIARTAVALWCEQDFSEQTAFELHFVCARALGERQCGMDRRGQFTSREKVADAGVCCCEGWSGASHEHHASEGSIPCHEVAWKDCGETATSNNEGSAVLRKEPKIGAEMFLRSGFEEQLHSAALGELQHLLFDSDGIGSGVDDAVLADEGG
jgi:hypothetical protein